MSEHAEPINTEPPFIPNAETNAYQLTDAYTKATRSTMSLEGFA